MWTRFMDLHSGGDLKENPFQYIYIEAHQELAEAIFEQRFGHDPNRVTCQCCGSDYSISEADTLEQATGFERGCKYLDDVGYIEEQGEYSKYQTLEQHLERSDVMVLYKSDL